MAWPWLVFGSNAISAYVIAELLVRILDNIRFQAGGEELTPLLWVRFHIFDHIPNPGWSTFAYAVSFTAVCFIPVWIMYRKKIFVKV